MLMCVCVRESLGEKNRVLKVDFSSPTGFDDLHDGIGIGSTYSV